MKIAPWLCWGQALFSGVVHAQAVTCEAASIQLLSVNFGTYQGSERLATSTGGWRFSCKNNDNVSWNVKICAGLGEGSEGTLMSGMRQMRSEVGASLPYQLYRDPAFSQVYGLIPDGIETVATIPAGQSLLIPTEFRLYARLPGGQPALAPTGNYRSVFDSGHVQARYRPYQGIAPPCSVGGMAPMSVTNFLVQATVQPYCEVSAALDVDFGSRTELEVTAGLSTEGKLTFTCSPDTVYSIALSDGINAQGGQRRMRHIAGGSSLDYELYHDSSATQRWGSIGSERKHGTASGALTGYAVHARLLPNQTASQVGQYKDTVVVTIDY